MIVEIIDKESFYTATLARKIYKQLRAAKKAHPELVGRQNVRMRVYFGMDTEAPGKLLLDTKADCGD